MRSVVGIATLLRDVGDTGVQRHSLTLRDGLETSGRPAVVYTPFSARRYWRAVFAVRRLARRRATASWSTRWYRHWHFVALRAALLRALRADAPRALLAQDPLAARAALDVRRKLDLDLRVVLAVHFNSSQADEFRSKGELDDDRAFEAIRRLEHEVLEAVDGVVYVSEWSRREIEERRGIAPRASVVIPNALPERPSLPPARRADLGLRDADLVLVNVGTLEPRKDQVGLVALFARLAPELPDVRLVLVGDGPDRARVEAAVAAAGLAGRVVLLGDRRDVDAILPVCDVYVHHARSEAMPLALLEAARAALPIAARPVGGIPELVPALGIVPLDGDDGAALAALRPLLHDPALRARLGRAARDGFRARFTAPRMVEAYASFLLPSP